MHNFQKRGQLHISKWGPRFKNDIKNIYDVPDFTAPKTFSTEGDQLI